MAEEERKWAEWECPKCGHQVVTMSGERPEPIRWSDGHVCYFKKIDSEVRVSSM